MTIRSAFYPVLGDYCWGWIGDAIDGYSIVMTVAGVCTSLGLGAMQMVGELQYIIFCVLSYTHIQSLTHTTCVLLF